MFGVGEDQVTTLPFGVFIRRCQPDNATKWIRRATERRGGSRSASRSLIAWAVVLVLSPLALRAADPPPDALPKGAVLRLGTLNLHHNGSAINVIFAPDGKSLVSSGNDHLVRLWDA